MSIRRTLVMLVVLFAIAHWAYGKATEPGTDCGRDGRTVYTYVICDEDRARTYESKLDCSGRTYLDAHDSLLCERLERWNR